MNFRLRHRLVVLLALIATLLHALAPVVSHAMMAKSGKSFVELCTVQGFQRIELEVPTDKNTRQSIKFGHECALCALAGDAPLEPTSTAFIPSTPAGSPAITTSAPAFVFARALDLGSPPTGPPLF